MAKAKKDNSINKWLKFRFGLQKRINLYERLRAYVKEDFPVYDSLEKFEARYAKKKDPRAIIIKNWMDKMKHGLSFSKAIEGWVPDAELNLILAGEEGEGIEIGLGEAIKFAGSAQKIKNTIISGITYPFILFAVVLIFVGMFSLKMAPTYLGILPLDKWPELGQNFYAVSAFIVKYWLLVIAVLVITTLTIIKTVGSWTGPARTFFDKLPPWSVYKVYQASAFLISLASMMKSGIPLNNAIKKIRASSSPWLMGYTDEMLRNLRRGGANFGIHLNVGLLDEETAGDLIDYSVLGGFEKAIYALGEKTLEDSVKRINSRMGIVKNLMIVLVGITVGIIYYTTIDLNGVVAESASTATSFSVDKK